MVTLYFECKLLSDVVMTQKSATEGHHRTLDFIPGNNFLGIVARSVYNDGSIDNSVKLSLFHNGDVRYGDAHPAIDGFRSVRIPASVFYPKLSKLSVEAYVHYLIPNLNSKEMRSKQLKQCRSGFYIMDNKYAKPVDVFTKYSIKSAYDKDKRRSEDEKMFGYQALTKGLSLYFQVDATDERLADIVKKALIGIKSIGRSKTAEYGLVEINVLDKPYSQAYSTENLISIDGKQYVVVYADSRLIFFDENGMPTLQPTPKQLGVDEGIEVDMNKSQIRIFQYSPYNSKRCQYDSDRYGIEKGSVFVVRTDYFKIPADSTVGYYKNEGFGKVLFNPSFLYADENGMCKVSFTERSNETDLTYRSHEKPNSSDIDNVLLEYLRNKNKVAFVQNNIFKSVNEFIKLNIELFKGESFASQWGTIRTEASRIQKDASIKNKVETLKLNLFGCKDREDDGKGYLTHGVESKKWDEKNRIIILEKFITEQENNYKGLQECETKIMEIVINLASQMAKKCKNYD